MKKFAKYFAFVTLLVGGCGPPTLVDDSGTSAGTLEADCASFCERAVGCSEEFAADWEFGAQQECVDGCMSFTNGAVLSSGDPLCEDISRTVWVCAGMLNTCDDFEEFEDASFANANLVGKPCGDEMIEYLDNCN